MYLTEKHREDIKKLKILTEGTESVAGGEGGLLNVNMFILS